MCEELRIENEMRNETVLSKKFENFERETQSCEISVETRDEGYER